MATSTIPAAIDYLFTTITAMPECQSPVVVCDGWPDQRADVGVVIGITPDDPATEDETSYADLGAQTMWELYQIPCIIWARKVGGDRPMKDARDAAFAILNAVDTHLRVPGATLGGVLKSGTAYVGNVLVHQTASATEAGEGRMCEIRFDIVCKSRSTA